MGEDTHMKTAKYKESFYNFKLTLEDGKLMIYNTKTGAIATAEPEKKDTVLEILKAPNMCRETSLLNRLISLGFVVKYSKSELDDIKKWHLRYIRAKDLISLTLLPAEACNFACPYCFIYQKRNILMKDEIFDAVYRFLEKRANENKNGTRLRISWFGGEPLLAHKKIVTFMERVKTLESKYKIKLSSSLVTNGYLLSVDLFKKLLNSGISEFQVTLDGDRETHNQLRPLKNGRPTFDVIYNNLKNIKGSLGKEENFRLTVRGNFLRNTIDSMERLLARFVSDFSGDERFSIYFRPVYNFETTRNDIRSVVSDICTLQEGLRIQLELAIKTLRAVRGSKFLRIFNPLPTPTFAWCSSDLRNSYIIGADGSLFMCDTFITDRDKRVGRITSNGDILLNQNIAPWRCSIFEDKRYRKCLTCKLLPICLGGCHRIRSTSGKPACFWTESDLIEAMKRYAQLRS